MDKDDLICEDISCPNCGSMEYDQQNGMPCEYCGYHLDNGIDACFEEKNSPSSDPFKPKKREPGFLSNAKKFSKQGA